MTEHTVNHTAGVLLDQYPYIRIGAGPRPLLIIPGAEVTNADPASLRVRARPRRAPRYTKPRSCVQHSP